MAFLHGKASRLLLGVLMYSGFLKEIENGVEIDMADTTTYGNEGHRWTPGLEGGQLAVGGFLDTATTAGSQHVTAGDALGASGASVITSAPNGLAAGEVVTTIEAREQNYAISTPIGEAVQFQAGWTAEGQVDHGRSLHDVIASENATGSAQNGTAVDNTTSSAGGASASLHVIANTSSTARTIKVQHSVDNSVWVDLITFTNVGVGATTSQKSSVAGTVNRYLRSTHSGSAGTGAITYAVVAARR